MSFSLPRVIGHRGAKSVAPENTLAAIRAAKRVGANFVEVDVMLSKDKVFVRNNKEISFVIPKRNSYFNFFLQITEKQETSSPKEKTNEEPVLIK